MNNAEKDTVTVAGSSPLYPLEVTLLKDCISCKRVYLLRKQVFLVVASCGWEIASRRFEGTYPIHYQCYESVN
jgi:hypothetical protein